MPSCRDRVHQIIGSLNYGNYIGNLDLQRTPEMPSTIGAIPDIFFRTRVLKWTVCGPFKEHWKKGTTLHSRSQKVGI